MIDEAAKQILVQLEALEGGDRNLHDFPHGAAAVGVVASARLSER